MLAVPVGIEWASRKDGVHWRWSMTDIAEAMEGFYVELIESTMRILIKERSGGVSEITGRPGADLHHILGRKKPRGFKGLSEEVKTWWPHPPMNCIVLTKSEHQAAGKYAKMMRVLLLNLLLMRYPNRIWEGKSYREWLNQPPFKEFL